MTDTTMSLKLSAGNHFPAIDVVLESGDTVRLGQSRQANTDWQLVLVYRGRHCPLCTKYLNNLQNYQQALLDVGVDIIAVSADSLEQLQQHKTQLSVNFPFAYGLSIAQMQTLGLYLSDPRSPQETDHVFAEPGLFVVNEQGNLHVVDISNNPFVRPELEALVNGIGWIRNPDNNYPIRGMHAP
ncbi:redoxin family protein [Thalassotalea sp. Y01]|nr:redoxin family protein [Thalassotalea sp. Y01]